MYRNLSRRVEAAAPVIERGLRERLWDILDVTLRDERQAWTMLPDGRYRQVTPPPDAVGPEGVGTHAALMESTRRRVAAPSALNRDDGAR